MADLPSVVGFNIYQQYGYSRYFCNIFTSRQTGAPALGQASATVRFRWSLGGQAIVRTDKAARDRSHRRVLSPRCPANPSVVAPSATAGRAAPRGGNGGSGGFAR